ncbi:MAG: hypothetical protein HRT89_09470 [Lentisphaeria bacterium]|nr:hypothetical protein [Lentisphaeria bacterium]NQZ68289.1 hypothetical protein [Lentisphaeria bacterium]
MRKHFNGRMIRNTASILFVLLFLSCASNKKKKLWEPTARYVIWFESTYDAYAVDEMIELKLYVKNNTHRSIYFGKKKKNIISFWVTNERGKKAAKKSSIDLNSGFFVHAGQTKSLRFKINRCYQMSKAGSYSINARLKHGRLDRSYSANIYSLRVFEPQALKENFYKKNSGWRVEKGNGFYFVSAYENYKLAKRTRIDSWYEGADLQTEIDTHDDFHVLYQAGDELFKHVVSTKDGFILSTEKIKVSLKESCILEKKEDDTVVVKGGKKVK